MAAKLSRWWSSPSFGFMSSIDQVVACLCIQQPGSAAVRFCDCPGTENQTEYLVPCAALEWTRRYLSTCPPFSSAKADAVAKGVFAEVFRSEQRYWESSGDDWWWVRERMVALAGTFGDDSLRGPLATYLNSDYVAGGANLSTTAAACNALASITGLELRFDPDGSPREVGEAAKRYLAMLIETE